MVVLSKMKIEWLRGRDDAVKNRLSPKFLIARRDQKKLEASYNPISGILSLYVNCEPEIFSDDIQNFLGNSELTWRKTNLINDPPSYGVDMLVKEERYEKQ